MLTFPRISTRIWNSSDTCVAWKCPAERRCSGSKFSPCYAWGIPQHKISVTLKYSQSRAVNCLSTQTGYRGRGQGSIMHIPQTWNSSRGDVTRGYSRTTGSVVAGKRGNRCRHLGVYILGVCQLLFAPLSSTTISLPNDSRTKRVFNQVHHTSNMDNDSIRVLGNSRQALHSVIRFLHMNQIVLQYDVVDMILWQNPNSATYMTGVAIFWWNGESYWRIASTAPASWWYIPFKLEKMRGRIWLKNTTSM